MENRNNDNLLEAVKAINNLLDAKLTISEDVKIQLKDFKHILVAGKAKHLSDLVAYVVLQRLLKDELVGIEHKDASINCTFFDNDTDIGEIVNGLHVCGIPFLNSQLKIFHHFDDVETFFENQKQSVGFGIYRFYKKIQFAKNIQNIRSLGGELGTIIVLAENYYREDSSEEAFAEYFNSMPQEYLDNTMVIKTVISDEGMLNLGVFTFAELPSSNIPKPTASTVTDELESFSRQKIIKLIAEVLEISEDLVTDDLQINSSQRATILGAFQYDYGFNLPNEIKEILLQEGNALTVQKLIDLKNGVFDVSR